jgi:hypothetical protein
MSSPIDPTAETSTSESRERQEQDQEYPELPDDAEWDDDLDGEGDIDEDWIADPDDGVSNQSSATLSSIASSSKRGYDEIDSDNENDGGEPSPQNTSPGTLSLATYLSMQLISHYMF